MIEELGQIVFCCYNVDISCSIDGWYEFWEAVNIEVSYLTHTLHVRCHQGRGNNLWLMRFDCSGYKSQEGSNVQDVFGITIYFCSNLAACQALEQYVKNKSRFDGCGLWWPPFFLETFKSCVNSPCRGFWFAGGSRSRGEEEGGTKGGDNSADHRTGRWQIVKGATLKLTLSWVDGMMEEVQTHVENFKLNGLVLRYMALITFYCNGGVF